MNEHEPGSIPDIMEKREWVMDAADALREARERVAKAKEELSIAQARLFGCQNAYEGAIQATDAAAAGARLCEVSSTTKPWSPLSQFVPETVHDAIERAGVKG